MCQGLVLYIQWICSPATGELCNYVIWNVIESVCCCCECVSIVKALSYILFLLSPSLIYFPLSLHRPNISSHSLEATQDPLRFKLLFLSLLPIKSSAGHKGPAGPLCTIEVRCIALLYELFCASQRCREVLHLTDTLTDIWATVCHPLPLSVASFISCYSCPVLLLSSWTLWRSAWFKPHYCTQSLNAHG